MMKISVCRKKTARLRAERKSAAGSTALLQRILHRFDPEENVFIFSEASAAGYSEPFPAGPVSEALLSYAADLFWGDSFSYEDPFSAGLSSYAGDPSWAEFFSYAADP